MLGFAATALTLAALRSDLNRTGNRGNLQVRKLPASANCSTRDAGSGSDCYVKDSPREVQTSLAFFRYFSTSR